MSLFSGKGKKAAVADSGPSPLSDETVKEQNDWAVHLGGTVAELQSVADQACHHHESYLAALGRMGELYAYCGRLMVRVNTSALAVPHPIGNAAEARIVAAQVKLSMNQWRNSSDELAFGAFLKTQKEEWQMWDAEVHRFFEHIKERQRHCNAMDQLRKNLKRVEKKNTAAASDLRRQLSQLEDARVQVDRMVQHGMEEYARLCSKDLISFGTSFIDLLSRSGQVCALSFQPIGFTEVSSTSSSSRQRGRDSLSSLQNRPTETVMGRVLERPSADEVVEDSTDAVDGISYTRSYTYLREAAVRSAASSTPASPLYPDPSTA